MSRESDFLSRWARRKAEAREAESQEELRKDAAVAAAAAEPAEAPDDSQRPATEEEIAALPDPDSLELGADFKPYLRPGIPDALRRRALRRLWRVNPVFSILDGMNEYDLDYTDAATVVENLKTAYQVGRGFVLPEDEEKTAAADATQPASSKPADSTAEPGEKTEEPAAESDELRVPEVPDEATAEQTPAQDRLEAEEGAGETADAPAPPPQRPATLPGQAAARRWARFSVPGEG